MKKINLILVLIFLFNVAIGQTSGQNKKVQPAPAPAKTVNTQAEKNSQSPASGKETPEMQAIMAYMTPGPMHEMMAQYDGEWKESITFWISPDAPPQSYTGTCSNYMTVEGRYQESRHISMMNNMPFEGTGYLGYDNAKKVFVSTWFDNMGTGILFMEGTWDEKIKTIHFSGMSVDPITGKDIKVREEFTFVDNNKQHLEMYITKGGKEYKSLEINFTR